jgi:hypothetical protein
MAKRPTKKDAARRRLELAVRCPKCPWKGTLEATSHVLNYPCPACGHRPVVPEVAKRSKYRNVKTEVDGLVFDSKAEAECYRLLKARQDKGEISDLRTQVTYRLEVGGVLVCKYVADFTFTEGGKVVVADRKGYRTREYRLKRKLMRAIYNIEIQEL